MTAKNLQPRSYQLRTHRKRHMYFGDNSGRFHQWGEIAENNSTQKYSFFGELICIEKISDWSSGIFRRRDFAIIYKKCTDGIYLGKHKDLKRKMVRDERYHWVSRTSAAEKDHTAGSEVVKYHGSTRLNPKIVRSNRLRTCSLDWLTETSVLKMWNPRVYCSWSLASRKGPPCFRP